MHPQTRWASWLSFLIVLGMGLLAPVCLAGDPPGVVHDGRSRPVVGQAVGPAHLQGDGRGGDENAEYCADNLKHDELQVTQ